MQFKMTKAKICRLRGHPVLSASYAEAAGVLTIGRNEDSTTFDRLVGAECRQLVFSNVFDVLVRVDAKGYQAGCGHCGKWTVPMTA